MTRIVTVVLWVLGISSASFAKGNKASWANLSALQAGEKIQVVETGSKKVTGTFVNFSDTAISLEAASGEQTIQREDVRNVRLVKNKRAIR